MTGCVRYERAPDQKAAIEREQQLERWSRKKKIALIQRMNPEWSNLSVRWSLRQIIS